MTRPKGSKNSPSGLTELEATIAKLASAVESSTNLMAGIAERVDGLETKIQEARKLPMVESPEARLEAMKKVTKAGEIGESQKVQDFLNPRGQDSGFQTNDIVKLSEFAEEAALRAYRLNNKGEPVKLGKPVKAGEPINPDEDGEQALGVVLNYMYTRRDGQRKYKVNFPKFGKSGFLEKELVLVKGA